MELQFIYMLIMIGFVILITIGSKKMRESKIVSSSDLSFAILTLKLSLDVVDELNLKKEKEIKTLATIVVEAIDYSISIMEGSYDNLVEVATQYAYDTCLAFEIELTDNRKDIVQQLIKIAIQNDI